MEQAEEGQRRETARGEEADREVERERRERAEEQEEDVLEDDGLLREPPEVLLRDGVPRGGRVGARMFLDARPGEVYVEEQEEDAEADDGGLLDPILSASGYYDCSFCTMNYEPGVLS